jgi:adenylate cyclase
VPAALARPLLALSLGLLVLLLGTGLWQPASYQSYQTALADLRLRLPADWGGVPRGPLPPAVVVIDIDEASLSAVAPWPWPRQFLSELTRRLLNEHGALAVGLDIVFPEQDPHGGDAELLALLAQGRVAWAAVAVLDAASGQPEVGVWPQAPPHWWPDELTRQALPAAAILGNFTAAPGACAGHITPALSPDGVARQMPVFVAYEGQALAMLPLALMACVEPDRARELAAWALARSRAGRITIPWRAGPSAEVVSALSILSGQYAGDLRGRYVLVGSSALGLNDRVATPFSPREAGVLAHAAMLDQLLVVDPKAPSHSLVALPLLVSLAGLALLAWALPRQSAAVTFLLMTGLSISWAGLYVLAVRYDPQLDIGLPWLAWFGLLAIQLPLELGLAQRRNWAFAQRFRRYLPPVVLDQLLREQQFDFTRPRRCEVTVLFVDMQGFTKLSDTLSPEQLVTTTEAVLSRLSAAVHDTQGTLDKYIGDAVMAFWGAPLAQADHADRAIDAALAMQAALPELNRELMARQLIGEPIQVCIGIESGEVVVGDIGTQLRQSYTVLGMPVNLAARLQDQAKHEPQHLLVGPGTAQRVRRHTLQPWREVQLRGRSHPDMVYVVSA